MGIVKAAMMEEADREHERGDWIARCRAGEDIPRSAIMDHRLTDLFRFKPTDNLRDMFRATGER
jgi:hypothetical protein